jgi:quercetin dioxygenase-like cupin family protein
MMDQGARKDQKKELVMDDSALVVAFEDIPTYGPPLHSGTVNRRLVPGSLGAGFEVVQGTIQPGGMGHRHHHATEWQVILLMKGEGRLELGEAPPVTIRAGTVVRIPPGMPHLFEVTGHEAAEVIVAYCPALGEQGFIAS